jgi:uncharacterized RDD family membrane protein YckC
MQSRQQNDTRSHHQATDTPSDLVYDGLHVQLKPTPFLTRSLALAVDYGILYMVSMAALLIAVFAIFGGLASWTYLVESGGFEGDAARSIAVLIVAFLLLGGMMVLTHGYFIYFEYKKNGQTPGKKIFGLKVVTIDGAPLSFGKCMMRETLRYVDTMLILPGLLSFLLTQKKQRLGDLLAGTMVSYSQHDSQETDYLYVKQSNYLYLQEVLHPEPVPEADMREYLKFAYQEFILGGRDERHHPRREHWEKLARQYVPESIFKNLDQLTTLLFFAEYCQQTLNRITRRRPHGPNV